MTTEEFENEKLPFNEHINGNLIGKGDQYSVIGDRTSNFKFVAMNISYWLEIKVANNDTTVTEEEAAWILGLKHEQLKTKRLANRHEKITIEQVYETFGDLQAYNELSVAMIIHNRILSPKNNKTQQIRKRVLNELNSSYVQPEGTL